MAATARPRRSALFMPGSNARALEKARGLDADVLILDLEDAVAPDSKAAARETVAAALAAGGYGRREIVLRVNGAGTPWGTDDIALARRLPVDAVLLPKVESAAAVLAAAEALGEGGPAPWCMIETPLGVLRCEAIAGASPRLAALVAGTSDLAKDLGARHTPDRMAFLTSLGLILLAARAHGLVALDGVHLDLPDDDGHAAACRQGADMGFDGKTLIHPKQLAAANRAFAPDAADLAAARRVIAAHAEAVAAGKGVVLLDGRLIENLHVEQAQRQVALAAMIAGEGEPPA